MNIKNIMLKYNSISIKWKIFIYLVGFCSILLVLLWLFQVVFLDNFYKTIKINEVEKSAKIIENNINSDELQNIIQKMSTTNDVCVAVIDDKGESLYSSYILNNYVIFKMSKPQKIKLFDDTMQKQGELFQHYNFNDNRLKNPTSIREPKMNMMRLDSIIYSKIVKDKNENSLMIVINSLVSPVGSTVKTLRVQFYYITIFMILFSIILALIIAKKVSKPIEIINNSAKILAKGSYDIKFSGSGYKEINELSDTLNFAAEELSKVDNLRRELIANISHDLRTPLTLISGYAEVMRDLPNENNPQNAQIIIDESKRLSTLVNDVLDISKIQSGVQSLNLLDFNLTLKIKEMIKRMNKLLKKDGYSINFIYDEEVSVNADETRILQVFYNLLINAVNYTGEDKNVKVIQIVENGMVRIEVIDTGDGITEENLVSIWDRYYKIDKNHKRPITGTGLGLSIVKSIIEMHKGECGVTSKVGEGSMFWFKLNI